MLWSGDFHGTFLGTDIATGEQVVKITTESGIRSLAAHPKNPRFVFCGLLDGFVVKIDVELMSVALSQQPHSNWIRTAAFSPSGALLITGANDYLVQILDETTLQPVATLRAHTSDIRGAQFLADGRFITVSDDRSIRIWNSDFTPFEAKFGGAQVTALAVTGSNPWDRIAGLREFCIAKAASEMSELEVMQQARWPVHLRDEIARRN
eukprot:TRINITY_DN1497_c0_g1_i9.p1 TRINITY_DN1497_c0_g1~~TRINITY_DN1497_c0_g1_i9.p1  ORF type:complete len:237 (-),score=58.39 TRINITY_DN1497_c0_g1_i9:6-629(-)